MTAERGWLRMHIPTIESASVIGSTDRINHFLWG